MEQKLLSIFQANQPTSYGMMVLEEKSKYVFFLRVRYTSNGDKIREVITCGVLNANIFYSWTGNMIFMIYEKVQVLFFI